MFEQVFMKTDWLKHTSCLHKEVMRRILLNDVKCLRSLKYFQIWPSFQMKYSMDFFPVRYILHTVPYFTSALRWNQLCDNLQRHLSLEGVALIEQLYAYYYQNFFRHSKDYFPGTESTPEFSSADSSSLFYTNISLWARNHKYFYNCCSFQQVCSRSTLNLWARLIVAERRFC